MSATRRFSNLALMCLASIPRESPFRGSSAKRRRRLLSAHDGKTPDWESFLAAHPAPANCLDPNEHTGEFHLQRELMRKMRLDGVCEPADAWLAVKLLAVLYNRVRSSPEDPGEELGKLDASLVRSLVTERRYLDVHAKEDFTAFIARLIEERIIRRHLWVGLRKFRAQGDYTFLIETDDGRVRSAPSMALYSPTRVWDRRSRSCVTFILSMTRV